MTRLTVSAIAGQMQCFAPTSPLNPLINAEGGSDRP